MNEASDYRHPKHDAMAALVREGHTDAVVAKRLHVDRRAVARVRGILGVPPKTNTTTKAQKLDRFSTELPDGHTGWTGRRNRVGGAPVIRHLGREMPAAAVVFEQRTGRTPVGICRADCGVQHCLTPDHVVDDIERRAVRMAERSLYGLPMKPWDECPEGHGWNEHGRIEPDLTPYCKQCNTDRMARSRAARKEEATA
jgi:hypothetical protein